MRYRRLTTKCGMHPTEGTYATASVHGKVNMDLRIDSRSCCLPLAQPRLPILAVSTWREEPLDSLSEGVVRTPWTRSADEVGSIEPSRGHSYQEKFELGIVLGCDSHGKWPSKTEKQRGEKKAKVATASESGTSG